MTILETLNQARRMARFPQVNIFCLFLLAFLPFQVRADVLDNLEQMLRNNQQIQEKVYVHTDNNCYFIGDTLWYKAYVLKADDHHPTNMSKLLYVELLSPDGLVVERQHVVVSDKGFTCGQFALEDSLYSGYYEIRAYTRWMLNFNVTHRDYTRDDRQMFYSDQMAEDYYRDWEDLYSRVIPVYSKPRSPGCFDGKYMYGRPKMEMPWTVDKKLNCTFYPEGGMLVGGLQSRVAFEVTDQDGKAVDVHGKLNGSTKVTTTYMGRGVFDYTPSNGGGPGEVVFQWNGKDYSFKLPRAQQEGVVLKYQMGDGTSAEQSETLHFSVQQSGVVPAAYAILCRGKLFDFKRLNGAKDIAVESGHLPSGVNEIQLYDSDGNVISSRLFFLNHNDLCVPIQATTDKQDYKPYEPIALTLKTSAKAQGMPISVSVRDTYTDDTSYNDGNMLTDMLLSSDLKGFIASPSYYFESNDAIHRQALDLLMMVQGWRKYSAFVSPKNAIGWGKIEPLHPRYEPEKTLTVEGSVNKQLGVRMLDITDIANLNHMPSVAENGLRIAENAVTVGATDQNNANDQGKQTSAVNTEQTSDETLAKVPTEVDYTPNLGVNHGSLKKEVLVEAELTKDGQAAGSVQKTVNGGKFSFQLPLFYDQGVLFITAYEEKDSAKHALTSKTDKKTMDEETYPEFYVKRDLFYPVFSHPYNYYQTHLPDVLVSSDLLDGAATEGKMKADQTLGTVKVEGKRRSRRAMDYNKPAYVVDAYDLYNEATDRGLSWGVVNMGYFPPIACATVFGNMNRKKRYNVLGKLDDYTFYQNFSSNVSSLKNRSASAVFDDLHLKRILNFRFYTDFEPRNYTDPHTEQLNVEDVTLVYETIPDNGKRYTYRDRRYIIPGITYPEQQYSPDYSKRKPTTPTDYRRTLYWNPNAVLDANGEFHATVYNNSKETRVKVSTAGVTADGKFIVQP